MGFTVTHRITGKVKFCTTRSAARKVQDKWDRAYGAYVAIVRPVSV